VIPADTAVLKSPLSTSRVTSPTPTLKWALSGSASATVKLCTNRALTAGCQPVTQTGTSAKPNANLAPGVYYWGVSTSRGSSATWEFWVGAVGPSVSVDTSWGTTLDVNSDGYADFAVAAPGADAVGQVLVTLGGPGALDAGVAESADAGIGPALTADGGAAFGTSLASAGDVNGDGFADLIVGAPAVASSTGAVYLFLGGTSGLSTTPTTLGGMNVGDAFGSSVASAGDVNGDGYCDVMISAPDAAGGRGKVYVYLGSASGLGTSPTIFEGGTTSTVLGIAVASAGDVNGDGFGDVLIASTGSPSGASSVSLHTGSSSGLSSGIPLVDPETAVPDADGFGHSIAGAGDVNGDGYADVVIGAPFGTCNAGSEFGCVYVYVGASNAGTSGLSLLATIPGPQSSSYFGSSVAGAGDVNGDGLGDIVVGAPQANSGQGYAYVYEGSFPSSTSFVIMGPAFDTNQLGSAVAGAGDVNGDGFSDVIIGSPGAVSGDGLAQIFPGGLNGVDVSAPQGYSEASAAYGDDFGAALCGATN